MLSSHFLAYFRRILKISCKTPIILNFVLFFNSKNIFQILFEFHYFSFSVEFIRHFDYRYEISASYCLNTFMADRLVTFALNHR